MIIIKKSYLKTFLKIGFVAGLLYFLSQKGFISLRQTGEAFAHWKQSGPAIAAMFFTTLLGILRWQLLLRAQGISLSLGRVTQLTLIGNFFNIALPGAVSGDFVKAFYIGKEIGGQRARAFGSILFDRVAGLSALVLVSASALLLGLGEFRHSALLAGTRFFVVCAALCVLVFYGYLFLVREHHDPALRILRSIEARFPKVSSVTRIYEGLRHYHNHRITVLQVLALSVVIHLFIGWASYRFAMALGETNLALLAIYVIVPLGLLVTAVPVAPAGVGTGHAAFLFLFGLLGSQRGADIYTLFALVNIAIGAIGGLVYLRFRSHEPAVQF
ncbi:lysylphosphatidylglycerol synthase transmembrane domain-containing protein [Bdellovibrionota bacterium FG-1]